MVANLTVPELNTLIKAATDRKNEQLAGARASFLDEVKAKAASLGMSLTDLLGEGPGKRGGSRGGRAKPTTDGKADARRKSPPAKYRNPATGDSWSGRGRPARWLTELEAQGHKREEFAV